MREFIKRNSKYILIVMICLFGSYLTTLATNYAFESTDVRFDNTNTEITAGDVQGALEQTFQHVTDYNDIKDTIGSGSLTTTSQTLIGAVNENKSNINAIVERFRLIRLSNNQSFSVRIRNGELWLLYRSYQPNLIKIGSNGAVEIGFGKNESINISASNDIITVTNTIGWAVNYFAFVASF